MHHKFNFKENDCVFINDLMTQFPFSPDSLDCLVYLFGFVLLFFLIKIKFMMQFSFKTNLFLYLIKT